MKCLLLSFALLLSTSFNAKKAHSVEVVYGMVGTMAIVGLVLSTAQTFGNGALKAEFHDEIIDVLALNDESIISQELSEGIEELREENSNLESFSDLEVLKKTFKLKLQ